MRWNACDVKLAEKLGPLSKLGWGEKAAGIAPATVVPLDVFSVKGKEIHANLEFYKDAVYLALGIPERYFISLFVCSRVFGW